MVAKSSYNFIFAIMALFFVSDPLHAVKSVSQPFSIQSLQKLDQKSGDDAQVSIAAKYSGIILTVLFLQLFCLTADGEAKESFYKQLHPEALIKNFLKEYITNFIVTFAHELGHAAMANILNDDEINIHLGANSGKNGEPLLELPFVSIDGLMPRAGYSLYSKPYEKIDGSFSLNKKKQAAILLSGGALGIFVNGVIKMFMKESPVFDDITVNQLFNMFVPFDISGKSQSDSSKFYRECLGIDPAKLAYISKMAPYLDIGTEFYLAHHRADRVNTQLHNIWSTLLIALINYQLRGFLRFKV